MDKEKQIQVLIQENSRLVHVRFLNVAPAGSCQLLGLDLTVYHVACVALGLVSAFRVLAQLLRQARRQAAEAGDSVDGSPPRALDGSGAAGSVVSAAPSLSGAHGSDAAPRGTLVRSFTTVPQHDASDGTMVVADGMDGDVASFAQLLHHDLEVRAPAQPACPYLALTLHAPRAAASGYLAQVREQVRGVVGLASDVANKFRFLLRARLPTKSGTRVVSIPPSPGTLLGV